MGNDAPIQMPLPPSHSNACLVKLTQVLPMFLQMQELETLNYSDGWIDGQDIHPVPQKQRRGNLRLEGE